MDSTASGAGPGVEETIPAAGSSPPPSRLSISEQAILLLFSWLLLAVVQRTLLLGRIPVPHIRFLGEGALELKGRYLFFAFANGLATDLVMFTLATGPFLLLAHLLRRRGAVVRNVLFALSWLGVGVLCCGLFANWMSYLTTDHALSFMMLAFFISDPWDVIGFLAREAGGLHKLGGVVLLTMSIPAAIGFLLHLATRGIPAVRRQMREGVRPRIVVVLVLLQVLFVARAAIGSDIRSLRGRYLYTVIREYEDPVWRLATGAIFLLTSKTIPRDLTAEEMELLRPLLTPGDPTPAIDPRYPLFRKLAFHGPREPDIPPPPKPANVAFVLLESTGKRDAGVLSGSTPSPSPCFDKLAGEGLLFRKFVTTASDSTGAFFSILSSAYPEMGRSRDGAVALRGSLPEVLASRGYSTGFSHYESVSWESISELAKGMEVVAPPQGGRVWADDREIFGNMLDWIDLRATEPWLATAFAGTHHSPWVLPGMKRWEVGVGDSMTAAQRVLRYQDTELCKFVDEIRRREKSSGRPTLLVVVGDHGNHIIDETRELNLAGLREDTLHVPFLLHAPGWIEPGTSDTLGSHVDLLPTILDTLGIEGVETASVGYSLLRGGQGRAFASSGTGAGFIAVIRDDRKLVFDMYTGEASVSRAFTDEPVEADPEQSQAMLGEAIALHRLSSWLLITRRLAPPLPAEQVKSKPGEHVKSWRSPATAQP